MARTRLIKPGFFVNEQLADLPFEYRLLFIGLWTEADREGRLRRRPKRLKAALFPYDDVDVDAGLRALSQVGLIVEYTNAGDDCVEVIAFKAHQHPHAKELPSCLPSSCDVLSQPLGTNPAPTQSRTGNDLNRASTEPAPTQHQTGPADTDTDTNTDTDTEVRGARAPRLLLDAWNEMASASNLPTCSMTEKRRSSARRRLSEHTLEEWVEVFARIGRSQFCLGHNPRGWRADVDFALRPDTFTKVTEGKYDDRVTASPFGSWSPEVAS